MNETREQMMTLGTFLLEDLEFGVDLLKQREVLRMMPVTKMPCAVDFIEGVINLRGAIVPIVNLRTRFGMPRKEFGRETRILNIEVTDKLTVGFIVDSVGRIRRMDRNMIEPPPPVVSAVDSTYIAGVARFDETLLLVLDVPRILSDDDIESLERMA